MWPALMPKVLAISAMLAAWKPRRAKQAPAASRICRRRISAGEASSHPGPQDDPSIMGSGFIVPSPLVGGARLQPRRNARASDLACSAPAPAQRPIQGDEIVAAGRPQLDQA